MNITIEQLTRDIAGYGDVADTALKDMSFSTERSLLYNIDFSLLYPYLWREAPPTVPPYKLYGRQIFDTLVDISRVTPPFTLVFTGPSFWELLDQICHQIKYYEGEIYSASQRVRKIQHLLGESSDFSDLQGSLIKAGIAVEGLEVCVDSGFQERIRGPIQKAKDLFSRKEVLKGLGDVVPSHVEVKKVYERAFNELFEKMNVERSRWGGETRDLEHRQFHYKVDCANIVSSIALNAITSGSLNVFFTTDSKLRHMYCPRDGRHPLVPTYWVSALLLKTHYIDDHEEFFVRMKENAQSLARKLRRSKDLSALSGFDSGAIKDFFNRFIIPLQTGRASANVSTSTEDSETFIRTLREVLN